MRVRIIIFLLLVVTIISPVQMASAASQADVKNDQVKFEFPETATFSATLSSKTNITSIVLEYGDEQQTCGEVIAKAFPQFTPAASVHVEWTWDMRQSGSLPPGQSVWWRRRHSYD